jgi:hypothetical protein
VRSLFAASVACLAFAFSIGDGPVAAQTVADAQAVDGPADQAAPRVVRAVLYMASLPLDANVQFMTVMATTMPFIGRG